MSDFNDRQLLRLIKDALTHIEGDVDGIVSSTRATDNDVKTLILVVESFQRQMDDFNTKLDNLLKPKPVKIRIHFHGGNPNMPGQMTDVQSITATIDELDAQQQPVTFDPTKVTWTIGDPTIATLTQQPDGSASFKALKVGVSPVGVSDSSNGLSAQDTLTVTADAATSLVIKFGVPA